MRIANNVVLVTGANRGLGRALVRCLLEKGARRIYASARSDGPNADDSGGAVIPCRLDVAHTANVAAAARFAHDVNIVINNAGSMTRGGLLDAADAALRRDMDVNFFGCLSVVRAFAGVIERNGGGAFVNILSVSALASSPDAGAYSASKAAAHSMTQTIRAELAPRGIGVFGVYPGPVDTDMANGVAVRKADPMDVARTVVECVERGEEDIWPDELAKQVAAIWRRNPKILERQFASLAERSVG
ncbi:SDR family oxidoreductase [Methylosinus sp. Ce-a6]|uniref:SDR family oxidoreductase n=1 Tax=Methylosinus sp. Ce-a6 TaxID=2172005 RepID=UPI0013598C51|nr:SDR family oxidoreductase [Methylosinus sp. Ce-a6]